MGVRALMGKWGMGDTIWFAGAQRLLGEPELLCFLMIKVDKCSRPQIPYKSTRPSFISSHSGYRCGPSRNKAYTFPEGLPSKQALNHSFRLSLSLYHYASPNTAPTWTTLFITLS